MAQVLAATSAVLFRDRDLFVHDGKQLRRFRLSAPVQAGVPDVALLVAWSTYCHSAVDPARVRFLA